MSNKVLGKCKSRIDPDDSVIMDGRADISCGTFDHLRQGEWLDNWMIMASMQILDKLPFIKCGQRLPLDELEPHSGNNSMRPMSWPLAQSRKTIESHTQHGQGILVHLCQLNGSMNHFTLLEINERTKTIYHCDDIHVANLTSGGVWLPEV